MEKYRILLFGMLLFLPTLLFADICADFLAEGKQNYNSGNYQKAKECFVYVKNECGVYYGDVTNWIDKCNVALNPPSNVDQNRVKRLIADICRHSSKGGNYEQLKFYFADTIFPHPSGKKRFRTNIANATRDFVEYYPKYIVSEPYNFKFLNNTFPLTVECDVYVTFISKKSGAEIRAFIHKIYYVTSDYEVSGFTDDEINRIKLN